MQLLLLLGAGFLAGGMNAVAGGGSFVSMPALLAAGLPATGANASSTVALVPGAMSSVWAYRRDINTFGPLGLRTLFAVSVAGGLVGAGLLLVTPTLVFDRVIPWLLLLAVLFLWFGPALRARLAAQGAQIGPRGALFAQALLAIYGGYFGGGVGLMMMALWTLLTDLDIKAITGTRILTVGLTNFAAVFCFVAAGAVYWPQTLILLAGAAAGGYAGAHLGQKLPARVVRLAVIAVTIVTTIAFFVRAYR
jgi:uncharacterized membrane protein YfcA